MMSARSQLLAACCRRRQPPPRRLYSFGSSAAHTDQASGRQHHPPPIFGAQLLSHLRPGPERTCFLDLTFGSGGHTRLLLDADPAVRVVAADSDLPAYQAARDLAARYPDGALTPVRALFNELPEKLRDMDASAAVGAFDGIVLDTACSAFQWADASRGFCPRRKGHLDLRRDPEGRPETPTASQVLQHVSGDALGTILKAYGGMKSRVSTVTAAIVQARYMFHQFKTVEELHEVLHGAAKEISERTGEPADDLALLLTERVIVGLRAFLNDELNELEFALSRLAPRLLRPKTGVLALVLHTDPEQRLAGPLLDDALARSAGAGLFPEPAGDDRGKGLGNVPVSPQRVRQLIQLRLWRMLESGLAISQAERTLQPRFASAALYAAQRTSVEAD